MDDQIGISHLASTVGSGKSQTLSLQAFHLNGVHLVGSADLMTKGQQQTGDTAHPRSGDTDEVDTERGWS